MRRLLWLCLLLASPLRAHEGHDHGADELTMPVTDLAPRLSLHSENVELVAAHEGDEWVIYVDDYTSNAPLTDLIVQVQQSARQLQAAADGEGSYRLPADLLLSDGATPLSFQLAGKGWSEQLQGVLPVLSPEPPVEAAVESNHRFWISAALAALLLLATLARRTQKRRE